MREFRFRKHSNFAMMRPMKMIIFAFATVALLTSPAQSAKRKAVKPAPVKIVAPPKPEEKTYPSPGEIVAAAPANDWVEIAQSDLLVMELAPDTKGKARRVVSS